MNETPLTLVGLVPKKVRFERMYLFRFVCFAALPLFYVLFHDFKQTKQLVRTLGMILPTSCDKKDTVQSLVVFWDY